jgi:UDP:flavonoid glycosyltransferase YjiC (YdhE family)
VVRPVQNLSVVDLQNALNTILASAEYAQNSKRLGKTLKAAGGVKRAVDEIKE